MIRSIQHTCSKNALRVNQGNTRGYAMSSAIAARQNQAKALLVTEDFKKAYQSPWAAVKDPKGTSLVYYWNKETNETTSLGAPKPHHWVEVKDPNGSNSIYWWNPDTDETTALGAPKPTGIQVQSRQQQIQIPPSQYGLQEPPPQTLGSTMKTYFALGLGISFAFAMVNAIM